ncbi:MAG TPA: ClbS/DfsB family four-helix bundle protein [Anaerolineales bacterium]|nr:ClbS/DfsB family four-helix bundle protein [Anaerolineales bacterium]
MNKEELITALEAGREALEKSLEGLSEEQYLRPGLFGEWTVKDLLVHLTMWEAQLITVLFRAGAGRKPDTAHFAGGARSSLNARWLAEHKDRPLERAIEDFEGIRNQTIRRIGELAESDLADPKRFPWLGGQALWQWVHEHTVEHEARHRQELEERLAR